MTEEAKKKPASKKLADEPTEKSVAVTETDALLPDPTQPFKLSDGTEVRVRQLNLREFLIMLRIVTRGASTAFANGATIDPGSPTFVQDFAALFIFAVAEAEYEATEFIRAMVDPMDNTQESAKHLDILLSNPTMEDTLDIVTYVIAKAAPSIEALGKRLTTLLDMAQRVGQFPK